MNEETNTCFSAGGGEVGGIYKLCSIRCPKVTFGFGFSETNGVQYICGEPKEKVVELVP